MKKIGLVGLPNAGKSSFFKLLTRKETLIANYCFSTVKSEVESFKFDDKNVYKIRKFFKNPKISFSELKIVDIPGIVKNAFENVGMGSKFISYIKECDSFFIVIRFFRDEKIIHYEGEVNPIRDFRTIMNELIMSDAKQIIKKIEKNDELKRNKKIISKETDKENEILWKKLEEISSINRDNFKNINETKLKEEEEFYLEKNYEFLTKKSFFIIANCNENEKQKAELKNFRENFNWARVVEINIKKEIDLFEKENKNFENEIFWEEIKKCLKIKSFITAGEKEVKSWITNYKSNAKECARNIHSEIANKLIRVILLNSKDWNKQKDFVQKKKIEKKDYMVKDGDICEFIFN